MGAVLCVCVAARGAVRREVTAGETVIFCSTEVDELTLLETLRKWIDEVEETQRKYAHSSISKMGAVQDFYFKVKRLVEMAEE